MATRVIILALFLLTRTLATGQSKVRNFELGLTAVTVNSPIGKDFFGLNSGPYEPLATFADGILFRYSHQKIALRAFASYTKYKIQVSGYASGTLMYEDLKIGIGGQYYILKKVEGLYTFVDVAYNNVYWSGSILGDTPNDMYAYKATIIGIDSYVGLGFKFKMLKRICIFA